MNHIRAVMLPVQHEMLRKQVVTPTYQLAALPYQHAGIRSQLVMVPYQVGGGPFHANSVLERVAKGPLIAVN